MVTRWLWGILIIVWSLSSGGQPYFNQLLVLTIIKYVRFALGQSIRQPPTLRTAQCSNTWVVGAGIFFGIYGHYFSEYLASYWYPFTLNLPILSPWSCITLSYGVATGVVYTSSWRPHQYVSRSMFFFGAHALSVMALPPHGTSHVCLSLSAPHQCHHV